MADWYALYLSLWTLKFKNGAQKNWVRPHGTKRKDFQVKESTMLIHYNAVPNVSSKQNLKFLFILKFKIPPCFIAY